MSQQPSVSEVAPATPATAAPSQPLKAGTLGRDAAIREQLENANNQRGELQERLSDNPDAGTQQLLRQQLARVSGTVLNLDEAIAATGKQIAAAMSFGRPIRRTGRPRSAPSRPASSPPN